MSTSTPCRCVPAGRSLYPSGGSHAPSRRCDRRCRPVRPHRPAGRTDSAGKLDALDAGADDHLTKPFAIDELLARLRALSRRSPAESHTLEVLVDNPKDLVTKHLLLTTVWGAANEKESGYLRLCLGQLRKKLEPEPSQPRFLLTEPGMGDRFATGPSPELNPRESGPPSGRPSGSPPTGVEANASARVPRSYGGDIPSRRELYLPPRYSPAAANRHIPRHKRNHRSAMVDSAHLNRLEHREPRHSSRAERTDQCSNPPPT